MPNNQSFEFDENKSRANKQKHGLDFIEAQTLWDDDELLEFPAKKVQEEERFFVIGIINQKYWTAVVTYRSASMRIIPVRRSRYVKSFFVLQTNSTN